MSTDFWSEDDRPQPRRARGLRWWHVVGLALIGLLALFGVMGALFPREVADRWIGLQVRQIRADILNGTMSPAGLREHLQTRNGGLHLALRLSQDTDPRVRAAAIEALADRGQRAEKRDPNHLLLASNQFSDPDVGEAFERLLVDPDPTVRRSAIRAVSALEQVRSFRDLMLRILNNGPVEERLIVSDHLAHWNGAGALHTFGNPGQTREVRLAALRGTDRYDWGEVVQDRADFVRTMKRMQNDPDADLARAATDALRNFPGPNGN